MQEYIIQVFEQARAAKLVKTRSDFADLLEINRSSLSAAMNGNEKYLTESMVKKVRKFHEEHFSGDGEMINKGTPRSHVPKNGIPGT